jgi:aldehyde:ferredoxin oxidoreductase
MAKVIRVNMTEQKVTVEPVPEQYAALGGRALTSRVVFDEVPANCDPLGPYNKIVIAPGVLAGTAAPSSGRISVGGKSPLTGGIKEANAGTPVAQKLGRMQIKMIVVEGQAPSGSYLLKLTNDGAELLPADELKGKMTREINKELFSQYGEKAGIMTIGVTGDFRMSMAGICFNDTEGRASRYAGRGGLGAVLGSKGFKAMVVDDQGAPGVELSDKDLFKQGQKKMVDALRSHDVTKPGGALNTYGTAVLVNILNEAGGLPTRNFSSGQFDGANKTGGEAIAEAVQKRNGGMTGHGCHPGCIIRCSNVYPNEDGTELTSCVEYESTWALGANCDIDNLDHIAKMVDICNEIGVDTIEAGVTIGVAMDVGVIPFGDGEGAIKLLEEICDGTPLGRILGNGAWFTGKAYGSTRIPTVKRQGMPAYEPRAVKGIGVTYITTTMGADHTAGYTIAPEILAVGGKVDPLSPEGKVELSRAFQATTAFIDASGYCLFIAFAILDIPSGMEGMVESVNGVLGTDWKTDDVIKLGMETLKLEWEFNKNAGFSKEDDRPPEFMRYEKLPPHNKVFDIPDEELDKIWAEFQ